MDSAANGWSRTGRARWDRTGQKVDRDRDRDRDEDEERAGATGDPGTTGDVRVDRIIASLDGLDEEPVDAHAGRYLDILGQLSRELNPEPTPEQPVRRTGDHGSA
jgi:hypothetical protein